MECSGSNALLADGTGVLWDVDLFVETVVPEPAPELLPVSGGDAVSVPDELPEHEAAVLMGVGFEPTEVDEVAVRSGVGIQELLPALALLELKGYVARSVGGAFVRKSVGGGVR